MLDGLISVITLVIQLLFVIWFQYYDNVMKDRNQVLVILLSQCCHTNFVKSEEGH